jgi:hypothetical protein
VNINPFILTQIGDKQNQLILSPAGLEKAALSDYVYSFFDTLNDRISFFRCLKMNGSIVTAYYWSTSIPEKDSNRCGLYVIIGFITDDYSKWFDDFTWVTRKFYEIMEDVFRISFSDELSDELFTILQTETDEKMEDIQNRFQKSIITLPKSTMPKPTSNAWFKKPRTALDMSQNQHTKIKYIYQLNERPNFFDNWDVFAKEALYVLNQGGWDVSTLDSCTPDSLILLENGCKIPLQVSKANIGEYQDCKYILFV